MVALIRSPYFDPWTRRLFGEGELEGNLHPKLRVNPSPHIGGVAGGVIMSKLGNETAKYAWESSSLVALHLFSLKGSTRPCYMEATVSFILFKTLWWRDGVSKGLKGIPWLCDILRFVLHFRCETGLKPESKHPTADEREALNSYFHLSARLYPCGECASEFQALLQKFPPQVSCVSTLCDSISLIGRSTDLIQANRFTLVLVLIRSHFSFFWPQIIIGYAHCTMKSINDWRNQSLTVRTWVMNMTVVAGTVHRKQTQVIPTQWT